ncbi:hypothetical protein BpHYR1_014616 [Brachionus plicatilis]|uniref:Uncharacterized protein n=1 Tax=Brachionus plicatilis TaxID=10195 RepID=A0A3M7QHX5_BRAPC|nr:hypothetical protein BpHYR1_014616 [Brachionus plicatilis]
MLQYSHFYNLSLINTKVTTNIHTNPAPLLKLIHENFGGEISNEIEHVLFASPTEQDLYMNNLMKHEPDQQ